VYSSQSATFSQVDWLAEASGRSVPSRPRVERRQFLLNIISAERSFQLIEFFYSSQSFYAIINYRGITPIYIPAVWNIVLPPKVQLFMWLLSHNKLDIVITLRRKSYQNLSNVVFVLKRRALTTYSLIV
jgi:hypothetical protein